MHDAHTDAAGEGAETIFGVDLPLEACHDIMHALPGDWTEPERWLMTSKWFDYRFMHPVQATYLFTDAYRRVYKQMYATTFDRDRADYVKGIKAEDPFDLSKRNTDRAGLWKARQMADGLCMPYDLYIGIAMHWSLRKCRKEYLPPRHTSTTSTCSRPYPTPGRIGRTASSTSPRTSGSRTSATSPRRSRTRTTSGFWSRSRSGPTSSTPSRA